MTIRLTPEERETVRRRAQAQDIPVAIYVRRLLKDDSERESEPTHVVAVDTPPKRRA